MDIYLVRHPKVAVSYCYGWTDVPIVPGQDDVVVNRLRQILPSDVFERVYSSPLTRCRLVANALSANAVFDDRLLELNFGDWEGKPWKELAEDEVHQWSKDLEGYPCPGGERGLDLLARVTSFWEELCKKEESALVITHAGWIRALLSLILETNLKAVFRINIGYGSVVKISKSGGWVQVQF